MRLRSYYSYLPFLLVWLAPPAAAQPADFVSPELQRLNVIEHVGQTIPLDVRLVDDQGQNKVVGDYFKSGKPVMVVMAYYTCPMLCTLVLNGLGEAMRTMSLQAPRDFTIVTVSIDPRDTAALAAAKKKNYIANVGRDGLENGWWFSVTEATESRRLADALGFNYFWDEPNKQYAHPAVIMVLTPEAKISRYLYGIEFKTNDVKMSLLEAAAGKVGTTLDRILLYCYHYDPDKKGYVVLAGNIMKLGGAVTVVLLALFLGLMWTREKLHKKTE
jgi:protein SCO1/2